MSETEYHSLYEIVLLEDGRVALREADNERAEPLVAVEFSEQAKYFLGTDYSQIARSMIEAGLDAVSSLEKNAEDAELDDSFESAQRDEDTLVH